MHAPTSLKLALAALSLSTTTSAAGTPWSFIAYDDASCQTNGRLVTVSGASCVNSMGAFQSAKVVSGTSDPAEQARFFCDGPPTACSYLTGSTCAWYFLVGGMGSSGSWTPGSCLSWGKTAYGAATGYVS